MNEPIQRRPQIGDLVRVGDLPETFRVLDFDGSVYVLESEHRARCKAGVLVVKLAGRNENNAA